MIKIIGLALAGVAGGFDHPIPHPISENYHTEADLIGYLAEIKPNCVNWPEFGSIVYKLLASMSIYQFAKDEQRLTTCFQRICEIYDWSDSDQLLPLTTLVMNTITAKKKEVGYWLYLMELCDQTEFRGSHRTVMWIREYASSQARTMLISTSSDLVVNEPDFTQFPLINHLFAL